MSHVNSPPKMIPLELFVSPAARYYHQKLNASVRLLHANQSGTSKDSTPAESDEFARRYILLMSN